MFIDYWFGLHFLLIFAVILKIFLQNFELLSGLETAPQRLQLGGVASGARSCCLYFKVFRYNSGFCAIEPPYWLLAISVIARKTALVPTSGNCAVSEENLPPDSHLCGVLNAGTRRGRKRERLVSVAEGIKTTSWYLGGQRHNTNHPGGQTFTL